MSEFIARTAELAGEFTVAGPIEEVFELFSPLGEKRWVPEWRPELLHPPGFRTQEERGEAVWIVITLDRAAHHVEYHRVESERYVARVGVQCRARADGQTHVTTVYAFVGLSPQGNADIGLMTTQSHAEKMSRWQRWISEYLSRHQQE